jgi:DNA-binding CsgD family transcriptional regulator
VAHWSSSDRVVLGGEETQLAGGDDDDVLGTLPAELTLALQTAELSSFVGRGDLVATAIAELRDPKVRLLTLRGTGGVGKTRVMQRIVAQVENARRYRDGVCFVSLVDLPADGGDAALIGAIGRGLGIPNNVDKPLRRMFELLRGKQLLLVLDNCEHLALSGGLPRLLTMLLKVSAELQVLATSRGDLEVDGEFVLEVPPLCVGDPQVDCDCEAAAPPDDDRIPRERLPGQRRPLVHTAVQLLRDRAGAVGVTITDEDLPLAERLCRINGGLPLGIELSAKTLKTAPIEVLVAQRDLQQPTRNIPGIPHNHDWLSPTLRFTASYLPAELRRAWATLSVFEAGSFDWEAAAAILDAVGATTHTHRPLMLLDGLIGQSIVMRRPDGATGVPRYEMLPPLVEFGRLLLDGAEPASAQADGCDVDDMTVRPAMSADHIRARDAHATYFETLVARCAEDWFSHAEARLLARIKADGPNVDAAITWLLAAEHQPTPGTAAAFRARGQQMAINYVRSRAPIHHGNMSKARNLLRRSLTNVSDAPNPLHVVALALQAWLAMIQGDPVEAQQLLGRAESISAQLNAGAPAGSPAMMPWPLLHARATWLWLNCSRPADIEAAMNLYATASRQAHLGHGGDAYMVDLFRAMAAAFHLPPAKAARYAAAIRQDAEAAGAAWSISWALWVNALIELRRGNPQAALELAQQALRTQDAIADTWGPAWSLWLIALILMQLGQHERAAQILGGAAAIQHLSQGDVTGLPTFLSLQRTHEAIARHVLGEDTFNAEVSYWRELGLGARRDVERIRELAYTAVPRTAPLPGELTSREWEVAVLIAEEGLTYHDIAKHLGLSGRTIEHYMRAIKSKLHVGKRQEVVAWVRNHRSPSSA